MFRLKSALYSFVDEIQTRNFNTYNVDEVMIQTFFHKLFSEEGGRVRHI